MAAEFVVPADGPDIYRYFVVPSALVAEAAIVGVDFRPGDPSVVHHCLAYVERNGWGARMDARDAAPGFSVHGDTSVAREDRPDKALFGADTVAGWAPGAQPLRMPKGLAQRLAPGGDFILEVHYHPSGKAASDRSALALYFAKEPVERYTEGLVIGTENIDIPPGESEYVRHVWMELPSAVELIDVNPHMHFLGRDVDAVALLPDGGREADTSPDWFPCIFVTARAQQTIAVYMGVGGLEEICAGLVEHGRLAADCISTVYSAYLSAELKGAEVKVRAY